MRTCVYNETQKIKIIQVKTHKLYIIKNKVSTCVSHVRNVQKTKMLKNVKK